MGVWAVLALLACGSEQTDSPPAGSGGAGGGSGGTVTGTAAGTETGTPSGAATGGDGGAGGQGLAPNGEPIEAPPDEWTWVEFDDAFCANGSHAGIGINPSEQSSTLLVYLMGGGACWSHPTCYGPPEPIAVNIASGYGASQFEADAASTLQGSLFDRNDPDNPLRDASYVFVPYCTGDVHAGNNVVDYDGLETMHVGRANMIAFFNRIVPTFPEVDYVLLSGSSAGGFGAGMNWWLARQMFGTVRMDLVDDSGPPLPNPYLKEQREQIWRTQWGLDGGLPPGCSDCLEHLDAVFNYCGEHFTDSRGALLSYTVDGVIAFYFQLSYGQMTEGLYALSEASIDPYPQLHYFFKGGSGHVLLGDPAAHQQGGVVLLDWLEQMMADDPGWGSVGP